MGISAVAPNAGALMANAVTTPNDGSTVTKNGIILMIAGAMGFVISAILFKVTRNGQMAPTHSTQSATSESMGDTVNSHKLQK